MFCIGRHYDIVRGFTVDQILLTRLFKCKLKPPYRITHAKLRLTIWDTSFWTFWVKFGHKGP